MQRIMDDRQRGDPQAERQDRQQFIDDFQKMQRDQQTLTDSMKAGAQAVPPQPPK